MPSVERLGRLFFALALIGFGLENITFGHYVVARAAPWPADPAQQHLIAYVTGVLFLACGGAILAGRWTREAALEAAVLILGWSLCLHWPKAIAGNTFSGDWTNALKAVVLATGGLVVAAAAPGPPSGLLKALRGIAPHASAPFFLLAGMQHLLFAQFVETLVPPFIPFARFWTYFAAAALLAAGWARSRFSGSAVFQALLEHPFQAAVPARRGEWPHPAGQPRSENETVAARNDRTVAARSP
jgi:uncharacterized membrane protein YphA (DoxX/SURF4 family)